MIRQEAYPMYKVRIDPLKMSNVNLSNY